MIDPDLATRESRETASGAKAKTGTWDFMAMGALLGEQHSFMHDPEAFFWVLFWSCIHCDGPHKSWAAPQFDKWNYVDMEKLGTATKESNFMNTVTNNFTAYYSPFIPFLNELRKLVFPRDKPREEEGGKVYPRTSKRDSSETSGSLSIVLLCDGTIALATVRTFLRHRHTKSVPHSLAPIRSHFIGVGAYDICARLTATANYLWKNVFGENHVLCQEALY